MEIILAIVVASAVIFFGALISMGNERQTKAIDDLREQVVHWALQDLRIKHKRIEQDLQIPDPLGWLNRIAKKAFDRNLEIKLIEISNDSLTIKCNSDNSENNILFTIYSPANIRALNRPKNTRLSQYTERNPLMLLPRTARVFEFSILNEGVLFEHELSFVWKELTGLDIGETRSLWMYIFP